MVNFKSQPCQSLAGTVRVPSDKSISHRALLLSAIAAGESTLRNLLMGEDNQATMKAVQSMGVVIEKIDDITHRVSGVGLFGLLPPTHSLNLGNSGTGMRLLAGLLAAQPFESCMVGDASLMKRPMKRVVEPLRKMGARIAISLQGTAPVHILPASQLKAIVYEMPVASAQVKSCLLLAGLYAVGKTEIIEPALTRDHTERMLRAMGYPVETQGNKISLRGGGRLTGQQITVPADISSAAFFMVAASIVANSEIVLTEVGVNPTRVGVINILKAMGADITLENKTNMGEEPVADIRVRSAALTGIDIPVDQVPLAIDELPVILIAAACANGKTILRGAKELRVKESDRIAAMADGLARLGINVEVFEDGMSVVGGVLKGGEVDSHGDHRIAMSFTIAGAVAKDSIIIHDCANVATSFPGFIELANQLGLAVSFLG